MWSQQERLSDRFGRKATLLDIVTASSIVAYKRLETRTHGRILDGVPAAPPRNRLGGASIGREGLGRAFRCSLTSRARGVMRTQACRRLVLARLYSRTHIPATTHRYRISMRVDDTSYLKSSLRHSYYVLSDSHDKPRSSFKRIRLQYIIGVGTQSCTLLGVVSLLILFVYGCNNKKVSSMRINSRATVIELRGSGDAKVSIQIERTVHRLVWQVDAASAPAIISVEVLKPTAEGELPKSLARVYSNVALGREGKIKIDVPPGKYIADVRFPAKWEISLEE